MDAQTDPTHKYEDDQKVLMALRAPFAAKDLDFLQFQTNEAGGWAKLGPYVDARAVRRRLNRVLGAAHWGFELETVGMQSDGFIGTLSITLPSGDHVVGDDAAHMTDIEAIKGGASTALRRTAAAVAGIGEYLYAIDGDLFVDYDEDSIDYPYYRRSEAIGSLPEWAKLLPPESQTALLDTAEGMGLSEEDVRDILQSDPEIPANRIDELPQSSRRTLYNQMQEHAEAKNGEAVAA